VFEPSCNTDCERVLHQYYQFLRQNNRVSKDRKSVRMLESLIRLTEAHARLHMKSQASLFDAVTVVLLVEHTLMTCLFGLEPTPSVLF
jgi:DNA helicase MCM9